MTFFVFSINHDIFACMKKFLLVQIFLSSVAVHASNPQCPLIDAVYKNDFAWASSIIKNGTDLNCRGSAGIPVLIESIREGAWQIAKLIVDSGADVNIVGIWEDTPLESTCQREKLDFASYLIERQAKVEFRDSTGASILSRIASSGKLSSVTYLVSQGADINSKDDLQRSVIFNAIVSAQFSPDKPYFEIIQYLLDQGADPNAKDFESKSLLFKAVGAKSLELTKLLVSMGADVNAQTNTLDSPLTLASRRLLGQEFIEYLVNSGALVNQANTANETALLFFAGQYRYETIDFLLKNGADVNVQSTATGRTPLMESVNASLDFIDEVRLFVEHGANVNVIDASGRSALIMAAFRQKTDLGLFLISVGADVNIKTYGYFETPLIVSASYSLNDLAKSLIDHGADVNAQLNSATTALMLAKYYGNLWLQEYLISHGATH